MGSIPDPGELIELTPSSFDEFQRDSFEITLGKVEKSKEVALKVLKRGRSDDEYGEVDDGEGLLINLKSLCLKMDSGGFWRFVTARKKEFEGLRSQMPVALGDCVDPAKFVLEAISKVFPVDNRLERSDRGNDLG
ncbi:hypothetical protein ACFX1Z_006452 [Malus domestica]